MDKFIDNDETGHLSLDDFGDDGIDSVASDPTAPRQIDQSILATKAIVIHAYEKNPTRSKAKPEDLLLNNRTVEARLEEALGLAAAINLDVQYHKAIPLSRIQPATYIGSGALDQLETIVRSTKAALAIFDTTLSPVQQRNLEKRLQCKVIDRTGLILEIFGARAQTREGRLQVDLAFLKHRRSRLVRAWTHLERQRGGFGFTGGPGESQIELDRRMIDTKIMKLERDLDQVRRTRSLHRKQRVRSNTPIVALVGYTNAGKSTLFNRLTQADVFVENLLFATLDPTLRPLKLPNGRTVLLSDTVGFISNLPTQLVAAFRATLEEVQQASVILHVRDLAHDDHEAQKKDVLSVLEQLEIDHDAVHTKPTMIDVYNKIDLLPADENEAHLGLSDRDASVAAISAQTGQGIESLLHKIQQALFEKAHLYQLKLPNDLGALLAWCYRHGVIESRTDTDDGCTLTLNLNDGHYNYVKEYLAARNEAALLKDVA